MNETKTTTSINETLKNNDSSKTNYHQKVKGETESTPFATTKIEKTAMTMAIPPLQQHNGRIEKSSTSPSIQTDIERRIP